MLLYYITDRSQFPGDENSRRSRLLATVAQAARCGVDYIQLREKDLSAHDLETLTDEVVLRLRTENEKLKTGLLINSRTDVALACGANGVHLRSDDISPADVRKMWTNRAGTKTTIGVSCHIRAEVARAAEEGADFAVFGPVFEKVGGAEGSPRRTGLQTLHEACQEKIPVIALGGVTLQDAAACIQAGAAGISAIRLFQENEMGRMVMALHQLESVVSLQSSASPKPDD